MKKGIAEPKLAARGLVDARHVMLCGAGTPVDDPSEALAFRCRNPAQLKRYLTSRYLKNTSAGRLIRCLAVVQDRLLPSNDRVGGISRRLGGVT